MSRALTIWIKTLLTAGAHVGVAVAVFLLLGRAGWPGSVELRAALALIIFLAVAILVMAAGLTLAKIAAQFRARRRFEYEPRINQTLALEVVMGGQIEELKQLARECAPVMSDCIRAQLSSVTGSAHRHISEVARELGLLDRWNRQLQSRRPMRRLEAVRLLAALEPSMAHSMLLAALGDEDEQVRIEAARGLVRGGDAEAIDAVMKFAATGPPLIRALVAQDLRAAMTTLCESHLPELLRGSGFAAIAGTLDIIEAWQKTLSIAGFEELLEHPEPAVQVRALRLAPYINGGTGFEHAVMEALGDANEEVRAAAAYAVGRIGLNDAIPRLQASVRATDERLALAAAQALSKLGDNGMAALEAEVLAGGRSASFALEALEKARLGHDPYVPT